MEPVGQRGVLRSLVLVAMVACAGIGCEGAPPAPTFQATVAGPSGDDPVAVVLSDTTGLVVGIGPAQFDLAAFRDAGVLADPSAPNAFILTWLGGMCDSDAALVFSRTDAGFDLRMELHGKPGFGCPAAGVPRALRVETSGAIAVAEITVSGSKSIQFILEEDCGPLRAAGTNDAKVACLALIQATLGDRTDEFARVQVAPDAAPCSGSECSTADGVGARAWRVDAIDRKGGAHAWRCTYRPETAACVVVTGPAAS